MVLVGPRPSAHDGCGEGLHKPHTPEGAGTFRKQQEVGSSKAWGGR